ncbi:class I SAM-dependent DNA methyltransferase, partial [Campylobacter coli]
TGIRYEWYCLQRWGANYYQEFEREKIVWASVGYIEHSFIPKDMLLQDTNYFFSTSNRYLLGILNSKPITYYLADIQTPLGNTGAFRNYKYNIEKLPIPKINSKNQNIVDELINLVDEILKAKEQDKNANTQELENKINSLVYKLYNLNEEEIKIIEGK